MNHNYFVYILTNPKKTTLYIGVTNDLRQRLFEHLNNIKNNHKSFTGRYTCYKLIYFELFNNINDAIDREKQLKRWSRKKKEWLISSKNPEWKFLNDEVFQNY